MDNIFRTLRLINVIYLQTLLLYFLYCTLWDNKKKLDQKLKVSWVVSGARRRNIFLFETVKKEGNIKNQKISPWRKEPLKQIYNQTIPVTQCSSETLFRLWYFCGIFVFHFTVVFLLRFLIISLVHLHLQSFNCWCMTISYM
jgi:hypothetical protein